jgi:ABC-2 type transport system ATP-binding protein
MIAMSEKSIIIARRLGKKYGEHVAVANLDLELRQGETLGLLGPNGAGKTTTINMMIGLLAPSSGDVKVCGDQDPAHAAVRKLIGVAPQTISLYEELTGEENLTFFGRLYGLSGRHLKQRVDWALEFSRLSDRRRDRVGAYSGGMKRRLNFACALVHEPKVVLLDEPTVGVDPQSRNHIFDGVELLQREGLSVIYTTHYMEEAQRLCDRVAIMDHGKLLEIGTVESLIQKHGGTSVLTGEIIGDVPDYLPGAVDGRNWRHESTEPIKEVAEITSAGAKFAKLQIAQPDLETVFLSLTGRSLRD